MSNVSEKLITMADNTPAVVNAVISAKTTASGTAIRADDVLNVEHGLQVNTTAGANVKVYGKNLVDYTKAKGRNTTQKVEIVEDGVLWKAGGDFFFEIPFFAPAGVTIAVSYQGENAVGECAPMHTMTYDDGTYTPTTRSGNSRLAEKPVKLVRIYKNVATTALTQDLLVTNIQAEIGDTATSYEPYKEPQTATADESGNVIGLVSVYPTMTLLVDSADVTAECTYFPQSATDAYTKYQQLRAEQTALQEMLQEYK